MYEFVSTGEVQLPGELDIAFFLVYGNASYQLPINPSDITINLSGNNEARTVISLGEINLLKRRSLAEITISSFFPRDYNIVSTVMTSGDFVTSEVYKQLLETIQQNRDYFRLIITGYNINMLVAIEDISWSYQHGDYENLYYELSLKEYRPYGIKIIDTSSSGNNTTVTDDNNPNDTTQKEVVIGSKVIVNGRLHTDSWGAKPGVTFSNKACTVTSLVKANPYPYHVAADDGVSGTGWVLASAVRLK